MIKLSILILQKICRLALKLPFGSRITWKAAKSLRMYFSRCSNIGTFQTTYDEDIRIWVSLSDHIESQIFWQGVQAADRGEVELLKSILRPDHIFFDIGANIGVFSLMAAKRLKGGTVHAFEPSKVHLKKLFNNLALNSFQNVIVNPLALSNIGSHKTLFFPIEHGVINNTGMASFFPELFENCTAEDVISTRIDDYVTQRGIKKVDVMKIDVEGSEMNVLEGGQGTLKTLRPYVVMEVNKRHLAVAQRTGEELIAFWTSLEYRLFIIRGNGRLVRIDDSFHLAEHQNVYCCPAEAACRAWV